MQIMGRKSVVYEEEKTNKWINGWCRYRGAKHVTGTTNTVKAQVSNIKLVTQGMFLDMP